MDMDVLCAAVQETAWYLERFTHAAYPGAFQAYTERFGSAYLTAVQEAAGEEAALMTLADKLLDRLESSWRKQRFWNRAAIQATEKQMLVDYLSPMLLELPEPGCRRLAEVLRDRWAARWPKDAYGIAAFTVLQSGFRASVLGIPVDILGKKSAGTE